MPVLDDLNFVDVYVRLDKVDQPYYRSRTRGEGKMNQFVPEEHIPACHRFAEAVKAKMGNEVDDAIDFENVRCRLSRAIMADGSVWACGRRINTVLPDVDKLGIPPHLLKHMKGLGTRDGLILISGATGAGKTTTAVALLAHFMRTYGGTVVSIEDPCEYVLKGRHGEFGQCFQIEVENEEDWAGLLKRALRWAPRYIYVGEIRTPKAAEQLLRAASTGHMVITTVHASTLEESLMGICFLAEQAMGPGVQNILSAGLTAMINQNMGPDGINIRYLYTEPDSPGDPVRSIVRENKIGALSTYIDRTEARLMSPMAAAGMKSVASQASLSNQVKRP